MRLPLKSLLVTSIAFAVPLFSGCHGDVGADDKGSKVEFNMKSGSLTLRKHIVIIKVSGHDPAYVTTHGHLVIGRTNQDEVPANDDQRAALVVYNKAANAMIDKGIEVGVAGAHFAADAIGTAIKDAVDGKPKDIEKDVKKGAEPLKNKAYELCDQLDAWREAQSSVARLIPAFEPYTVITDADIAECRKHGFSDTDDDADDQSDDDHGSADDDDDDSHAPASASSIPSLPAIPKIPTPPTAPTTKQDSSSNTKKPSTI